MEKITSYFEQQGWPAHIAKGIAANLQAESGLNHQAVGDGTQAYGLAQWHPPRQADFKALYGKDITSSTFDEQLAFIQHELTVGKERKAGASLRGATTAGDAARIFSDLYERPSDSRGARAVARAALAEGRAVGAGAGRGSAQVVGATLAQAATAAPIIPQSDPTGFYEAQNKNLEATQAARPSILEMMGAAIKGAPTARIYDAIFADDPSDKLDPNWVVPEVAYENRSRDEIQEIAETRNKLQYDNLLQRWDDESRRATTIMDRGLGVGIGLSLGAEVLDPTNIATAWATSGLAAPVAAVRLASGAIKQARAANIGRSVAANVASGTALELAIQMVEGRANPENLALSLSADVLLGVPFGLAAAHAGTKALNNVHSAATEALLRTEARVAEAQTKLGANATPEQIMAKAEELQTAEMRRPIDEALTVSTGPKLMSHPDDTEWVQPAWPKSSGDTLDTYDISLPEVSANEVGGLTRAAPDTPEFKQWFDNSAVTKGGVARVVYHSTTKDFESFSKDFLGGNTNAASAKEAFFFGGKTQTAEAYSQGREGSVVMPVYLSIQNPLVFDMAGIERRKIRFASLIQEAKSKGHDGVIIKNTFDGGPKDDIFAVFEPTQIKSAIGNFGSFSKTDPRIHYGPGSGADIAASVATVPVRQAIAEALTSPALVNNGSSVGSATRHLLTHLQKTLPDGVLDVPVSFDGAVRGNYSPAGHTISTRGEGASKLQAGYNKAGDLVNDATVLAHEITHSATSRLIYAVQEGMAGVSDSAKAAVARLDELRIELDSYMKANGIRVQGRAVGADYATKNIHEFVAQAYSDVETRNLLAKMPGGKFKNMLSAFADAVMQLLGLNPRTADSALREAVALIDNIIKEGPPANIPVSAYHQAKPGMAPTPPAKSVAATEALQNDPDVLRFGLGSMPNGTDAERADIKHMLNLWRQAEAWDKANPLTPEWEKRADNIINNAVFEAGSTGLAMLKSKNSLVRMVASRLLEDASGVQGKRGNTAAIDKYIRERAYQGNAIPDYNDAYALYSKAKGGSLKDDFIGGGKLRDEFNREVALETERRANNGGVAVSKDQNVNKVVDSFHAAYERIRKDQIDNKTLGWAGLPSDKVWYMPHSMSPNRVNQLTVQERQVLVDALTDQYVNIEGWDMSFADQLATRVVETVRSKALGNYESSIGGTSSGSAEIIEDAMLTMGMGANEVRLKMKEFNRGAANFTKKRIKLDLTKEYQVEGKTFKLLDVFETDPVILLRSQTGRVSGEVALARVGVYGRPGMALLRKAMSTGPDGQRLITNDDKKVLLAFDQISAEFINAPFGTHTHKSIERAMLLNSVANLGGMGITQTAEYINGIAHVGVLGSLKAVAAMPRMRKEIYALVRGEKVDNPLIGSIETLGGAEFGTDAYKMVMPFDNPNSAFPTYGTDTMTNADRLLRGLGHLQGKLSLWRAIHSVQQRGFAEQVVARMARYIKEGNDDRALQGFGFTPELQAKIKLDIDKAATFDARGNCTGFDVTKFTDPDVAQAVVQNVHRGVSQIIQGTFIGETGKWAHDGYLKALTQFRTFSLVSAEKQWGRQRNAHGTMGAIGILAGAMSAAIPIYYARVYAASIGREDQEAYLERRLAPELVARSVMNYVSMAGLAGDVFDVVAAVAPDSIGATMTGGRTGGNTTAVGNYFAPSAGYANDVWTAMQNLDEPDKVAKVLPFHNLPYLIPIINYMAR